MRDWFARFGSVVHLLLWVTGIAFLIQVLCARANLPFFESWFALSGDGVRHGFVWQFVTYMFLHDTFNLFHILINLMILWFFGREVEYFIGPKFFTRLYFLGGIIGALLWLVFNFNHPSYLLGASAGVLACVIAYATLFPDREVTLLLFFILPVSLKAKYLALLAIAIDLLPVLTNSASGVAHLAHLGGAALGYVYIKHLGYGRTPRWLATLQSVGARLTPKRSPRSRDLSDEEYMRQVVDPILEKIARQGMHSLNRRERKILESAKDHLGRRPR